MIATFKNDVHFSLFFFTPHYLWGSYSLSLSTNLPRKAFRNKLLLILRLLCLSPPLFCPHSNVSILPIHRSTFANTYTF